MALFLIMGACRKSKMEGLSFSFFCSIFFTNSLNYFE